MSSGRLLTSANATAPSTAEKKDFTASTPKTAHDQKDTIKVDVEMVLVRVCCTIAMESL
ncbi:MAG: hypothetical protein WB607_12680 [Candidatus Acidiferrum sp.]